jgi:hypothetical protein
VDDSLLNAYVWDCPGDRARRAAAAILSQLLYDGDQEDGLDRDGNPVLADTRARYFAEVLDRRGAAENLARDLMETCPAASFIVWEDTSGGGRDVEGPAGQLRAYTPQLGWFAADCDIAGHVILDSKQVMGLLQNAAHPAPGVAYKELTAAFDRAYGGPWLRAWETADPGHADGMVPWAGLIDDADRR